MGILDTLHDGAFSNDDPLRDAYLKMKSDETEEKVEVPEVESDTEKQVITEKTVNAKIQMDPVGKEDGDVDNDGDRDSSDKYLLKRRKAIQKSIAKNKKKAPAETKLNGAKDDVQINPKMEMSGDMAYRAMDKADRKSRGEMSVTDPKKAKKKARQAQKFADYSMKKTLNKEEFDAVHEYALEENMKRDLMGFGAKLQSYADKKGGIDKDYFSKIAKTAMSGRMPAKKDIDGDTDPRDFVLKMMTQTFPKSTMKNYIGISPTFDQHMKEAYDVKTAKTKFGKITTKSFDSHDDAKAHLASMNKKGRKGIISQDGKPVKEDQHMSMDKDSVKKRVVMFKKLRDKKASQGYQKTGLANEEVELDESRVISGTERRDTQDHLERMAKIKAGKKVTTKNKKPFGYDSDNKMNEARKSDYQLYHKDFSSAMQHAYAVAKKRGYIVDPKEIDNKVATGPRKPSSGKTNRYILGTDKKQNLHVQVANLDDKRFELNMYIESVQEEDMKTFKQVQEHCGECGAEAHADDVNEVESAYSKEIAAYKAKGGTVKKHTMDKSKVKKAVGDFKKKFQKTQKIIALQKAREKADQEKNKEVDEDYGQEKKPKTGSFHQRMNTMTKAKARQNQKPEMAKEEVSKNVSKLNKVLESRKRELEEGNITNQNNTMFRRFESMVEYLLGVSVENPDQFQVFPVGDNYRLEYEHGPVTTLGENDIINFMGPNVDKEMFIDLLKEFGVAITTEENSFVRGEKDQVYKEVETPYGEKVSADPPSTVPEEVSQDYADRYKMDNIVELIKKNANSIGGLGGPKYV